MSLNNLRDQVADFLNKLKENKFTEDDILNEIENKLSIIRSSRDDDNEYRHQIYDILYLLLELAAKHNYDLDDEWQKGQIRKQKYL
ncbi:MAG: hypothetical protein V1716_03435 [Candidatus Uhrbacteria bacterium]